MAGGGIAMIGPGGVGDEMVVPATVKSKLNIEYQSIVNSNQSCFGGGVAVFSVELAVTGGTTIQSNEADSSLYTPVTGDNVPSWNCAGAGILLYRQSKLNLLNSQLLDNAVITETGQQSAGAGVYIHGTSQALTNGASTLVNHNYDEQYDCVNYGGGFYVESTAALTINNGSISENVADYGAGVYSTGSVTINGGFLEENSANQDGGGIYSTTNLNIYEGLVYNNTVKRNGGGIYGKNVCFTFGGSGEVCDNKALGTASGATSTKGRGGGIYISAGGYLVMLSGSIHDNRARYTGGGVLLYCPLYPVFPSASSIYDNTKGPDSNPQTSNVETES